MTTPLQTQPNPAYFPVLQVPSSIDYTSKDWTGFVTSMLNYASVIMPQWDTSSEGDFGVMLIELVAYVCDILSFYGDRLTQEAYLPTATQRLSIINLAQLLGYVPAQGSPASGTVTFANSTGTNIIVPAGTQVATGFSASADQPVIYQTNADIDVLSDSTATVNVTQGVTYTQQQIGISDGTAGQSFQIAQPFTEDGTVSVYISSAVNPVLWNQVTFLVDSGPADQVYSVYVDENNMTNIQFGDNVNGAIPEIGLIVYATYTIGVGSAGNQPSGSVGVLVTPITGIDIPFQSDTTVLYQSSAMTGGSDPETNDQIRANAPQAYATQQRAVSVQDFASLALNIPGVLEASATANHSTSVTLYVLGPNYLAPSSGLQNTILSYFSNRMLAGTSLTMGTPDLVPVDIGTSGTGITLQVQDNYSQAVVVANVTTALESLLSPPSTSFGMLLNVSSVYSAIMGVAGVSYAIVNVMTREDVTQANTNSIQFRPSEIPVAGTMYITAQGGIS
jgi:hypothetical protein